MSNIDTDTFEENNQEQIKTDNTVKVDNNSDQPTKESTNQSPEYKQSEIEKTSSQTGEYLVAQGATCLCDQGDKIHLELDILSNKKVFLNDSSALATIDDNVLKGTFNKCKANPSSGKPCVYQPKNKWDWKSGIQDYFSEVNGKKYLTDHAILQCPLFPGIISLSYNGQEIDVPESDKEDIDSSIDSSIICLMDENVEPSDEIKKKQPNITSLSVKINDNTIQSTQKKQGQKNKDVTIKKIYLRKNKEYEFTATETAGVGYNYWYAREKEEETDKTSVISFDKDKGAFYTQTGSTAKFEFKKVATLYLEAFGKLTEKTVINNDCAFDIEVVDKNAITGIRLTPTEREKKDETTLLLNKNTLYTIELQTLLPIEEEDLENLSVEVHDTSIRFIPYGAENLPLFTGKDAIRFTLKTLDWGSYNLQIKRGKEIVKEYNFPILENEVKKIEIIKPKVGAEHWVRSGTEVTFEAKLSDNEDDRKRIYWQLDTSDIRDEHDKQWKHHFTRIANHTVKASYRGIFGVASANTVSCEVTVKDNRIDAIKADKNTQSICIGTVVTFHVDTPYIDLIDSEYIQWELRKTNLGISLPSKKMQYSIKPNGTDVLNDSWVKLGSNHNKEKNLSIQFNQLGTYTLTVSMGGKPFETPTLINVVKAHIESWYFCDEAGNKRPKIGWGQDFYIRVKINGCEGRHLKIAFWYDNRSKSINNRFYKIDSGVEQQDLTLGKEGIQTWKISSTKLWTSLQNLVKEHGSSSKSEYARIMFTISEIDTLCDNNKEYKKEHPLHGQIFPEKVDNTTASIPNTTEYKAQFLDSSKKNPLTDIISYTDQAYLSLQRINSPQDMEVKDLELRLWENKTGEDTLLQRVKISSFDKEGFIVPHPVDMTQITKTKQKNQSKTLPRFFYLQLNKMKDNKVDKIIYTYPEGYKTGKDNDGEIIILQKDDYTGEDIKDNTLVKGIVSNAKLMHGLNQATKPNKDKQEFDEKTYTEGLAEQLNADSQKKNKEAIDKSKNYFLQLKVAEDPSQQKSLYNRTGKQVGEAGASTSSSGCICKDTYKLPWGSKISCEARKKVVNLCAEIWGEDKKLFMARELMICMAMETGGTFSPKIGYDPEKDTAVGLVQFTSSAIDEINAERWDSKYNYGAIITKKILSEMTVERQLDYVKSYFQINVDEYGKSINNALDMYMCILCPRGVGKSNGYVLYSETESLKAYKANASIDGETYDDAKHKLIASAAYKENTKDKNNIILRGEKGYITKGDCIPRYKDKKWNGELLMNINISKCAVTGILLTKEYCSKCNSFHIDLRSTIKWQTQFSSKWGDAKAQNVACKKTCDAILISVGLKATSSVSPKYQIAIENDSHSQLLIKSEEGKKGIEYLNSELLKGNPVQVGIDHHLKYGYNEGTTDHFVVIVGKSCDEGKIFYWFYEVGTKYESKGTSNENRLYLDSLEYSLKGTTNYDSTKKYTVTQIRKNV